MIKIDKSWYEKPKGSPKHIAAGGVVVRKVGAKILIAAAYEDDMGVWALPKGHVDEGETIIDGAIREIGEETGITDLKMLCELGIKERFDYPLKASWKITHYFLFVTKQVKGIPSDPLHQKGVRWLSIENLSELFWPEQRDLIRENLEKIKSSI
jgi:ADP-ribose pyrophosphatase YjhB (NUDIX family)